jgi:hypothetical protein
MANELPAPNLSDRPHLSTMLEIFFLAQSLLQGCGELIFSSPHPKRDETI